MIDLGVKGFDFTYKDPNKQEGKVYVLVAGQDVMICDRNGRLPVMSLTNCFELVASQVAEHLMPHKNYSGCEQANAWRAVRWWEQDSEGDFSRVALSVPVAFCKYVMPAWSHCSREKAESVFPMLATAGAS